METISPQGNEKIPGTSKTEKEIVLAIESAQPKAVKNFWFRMLRNSYKGKLMLAASNHFESCHLRPSFCWDCYVLYKIGFIDWRGNRNAVQ